MNDSFQDRIDRLALFYMGKTSDISSMTVQEFLDEFNKICNELITATHHS